MCSHEQRINFNDAIKNGKTTFPHKKRMLHICTHTAWLHLHMGARLQYLLRWVLVCHCSLFEKVEHAEKENADLKQQLLACRGDLAEALEKAKEAEAAQAAAALHASTEPMQESDTGGNDLHSLSKPQLIARLLALQKELATAQHERRCGIVCVGLQGMQHIRSGEWGCGI
eukprot:1150796-Pelagomonas_calceolata.AAC.9